MTLNYRKDLIQTHPYLGNHTKEEREICRAKKSFHKPVSKKELPDQKALLDKAVKKTIKALRSEYEQKQKKAQGHIDLKEIRNRSVKVQKSNNTSKDTSDAIIRLKNDMKDRLGKLPILTKKQEKIDNLRTEHQAKIYEFTKKMNINDQLKNLTYSMAKSINFNTLAKKIKIFKTVRIKLIKKEKDLKKSGLNNTAKDVRKKIELIQQKLKFLISMYAINKKRYDAQQKIINAKKEKDKRKVEKRIAFLLAQKTREHNEKTTELEKKLLKLRTKMKKDIKELLKKGKKMNDQDRKRFLADKKVLIEKNRQKERVVKAKIARLASQNAIKMKQMSKLKKKLVSINKKELKKRRSIKKRVANRIKKSSAKSRRIQRLVRRRSRRSRPKRKQIRRRSRRRSRRKVSKKKVEGFGQIPLDRKKSKKQILMIFLFLFLFFYMIFIISKYYLKIKI